MKGLFIAGTDTACGKTAVGCTLARLARAQGLRVRVLKPVETGCEKRGEELIPRDALRLARAAEDDGPLERICPYRLSLPAAPQVAADSCGVSRRPGAGQLRSHRGDGAHQCGAG